MSQSRKHGKRGERRLELSGSGFSLANMRCTTMPNNLGHSWLGDRLDSHAVQKVATRAFKAALRVGIGRAGRPRFKGKNQIDSLEGKSNKTGIMWREGQVQWKGLVLQPIYPRKPDPVIERRKAQAILAPFTPGSRWYRAKISQQLLEPYKCNRKAYELFRQQGGICPD